MQRFNTRSFFDHKNEGEKENGEESEGLLANFDQNKVPQDLYEQFEQEQMIEDKEKVPSIDDPGFYDLEMCKTRENNIICLPF